MRTLREDGSCGFGDYGGGGCGDIWGGEGG